MVVVVRMYSAVQRDSDSGGTWVSPTSGEAQGFQDDLQDVPRKASSAVANKQSQLSTTGRYPCCTWGLVPGKSGGSDPCCAFHLAFSSLFRAMIPVGELSPI